MSEIRDFVDDNQVLLVINYGEEVRSLGFDLGDAKDQPDQVGRFFDALNHAAKNEYRDYCVSP